MQIYFAGSITGGRDDQALYAEIIKLLAQFGEVSTEHIGKADLSGMGESMGQAEIYSRDISWLDASRVLVAEVTTPSLGVGYEIGRAEASGKPTLCIYRNVPGRRLSAMISGNPKMLVRVYENLDDLKVILEEFFREHGDGPGKSGGK